ncbi:MAG TPA: MATE family efflux transporter [Candidatus Mediterraneibacter merdipullorum]|nr:MATE family efflux transporter [Candidatus Mediterraneibacter merdipullorum]
MENQTTPAEENTFMKTRPVFSLLVSMSVPMMLSMLIQSLYNIVDSIYVSRLGTDALTAVSLAYPLQNAIVSVGVGIGVGISASISIHLGAGDQEKADRAAALGVALTVFHCILFILAGVFITRPFLSLFTEDAAVLRDACDYTYIVLCLSFGALLQIAMEKIFQSVGQMKVTMYLLIAGCVINIILDPILIFGLLGFPAMGVAGAAIATVIGQICAFLLYIIVYFRRPLAVRIRLRDLKFDGKLIREIYSVGIPSSIMMLMPSFLISILNRILAGFSSVYVAVLGLLIPGPIFALFQADAELLDAGITALRIICLGFLVSSVGVIASGTFEALGNGRNSLIISLLRQFIVTIPLSFILSHFMGPAGVWISFPAGEVCAAVVAWFFLKTYKKGVFAPF